MSEGYVQVPVDSDGKKLRTRVNTILNNEVHSEVVVLEDGNGNIIDPRQIRTITETVNVANSNLDVALSTRASEQTLAALKAALASIGLDKVRTSVVDALPAGTNTIGNVNVGNFPTDYAKETTLASELTRKVKGDQGLLKQVSATDLRLDVYASYVANPSNFDVALSTRASESTLNALKNALSSVGADKIRVSVIDSLPAGANKIGSVDVATLPSLPAGTNKIGSVDAYKAGTWNIDNLLNPHPIQLTPEYKLPDANQYSGTFSPTAAGSTTIIAAVTDKVIRVYDFSLWNSGSADVTVELYFGTSGKRLFKGLLAAKTGVLKTYVRPWESNAGDSLVLALSAAGTCDYCIGAVQA
jgi:hypothetical protein